MTFQVKISQFEGPLHLLLQLIEREKLSITELSLAGIADEYLQYIESKEEIDLANLSEFLLVASQLMLIKSRALLPFFEKSEEEEEEIEELEERLKQYKAFKELALTLGEIFFDNQICFPRGEVEEKIRFVDPGIVGEDLLEAFKEVLGRMPKEEKLERNSVQKTVSIEERINHLQELLAKKKSFVFGELLRKKGGKKEEKLEIIVTFLAMLEMLKQRIILVSQRGNFGEIMVEKRL